MALTWDSNQPNQQAFVDNLDSKLKQLRSYAEPLTVYSQAALGPESLAPELYEEVQWMNPATNVLKNTYMRVQDLAGGATSQQLLPLVPFPAAPVPWTLLDYISAGDLAGAATQTFSNISQDYAHLMLYIQVRATTAATSGTLTVRPNGTATATYGYSYQAANTSSGAGGGGTEQVGSTGVVLVLPANTAWRGYFHEGFMKFHDYSSANKPTRITYQGSYAYAAIPAPGITPTTHNNHFGTGIQTSLVTITSLSLAFQTGLAAGSRICLFGI